MFSRWIADSGVSRGTRMSGRRSLSVTSAARSTSERDVPAAIDAIVEAEAVGPLSPPCSDADFLRRAFLDLAGTIPSADRARAFLADPSPDKRARLVDELLAAHEIRTRLPGFLLLVGPRDGQHPLGLAQPVWQYDGATHHLVGLLGIDAEVHRDFDGFVDLMSAGVAPHHAGLVPAFKEMVEEAFTEGLLKVVVQDAGKLFPGVLLRECQLRRQPTQL